MEKAALRDSECLLAIPRIDTQLAPAIAAVVMAGLRNTVSIVVHAIGCPIDYTAGQ